MDQYFATAPQDALYLQGCRVEISVHKRLSETTGETVCYVGGKTVEEAKERSRRIMAALDGTPAEIITALESALEFVVAVKVAGQSGKVRPASALPAPFTVEGRIRTALDIARQ